MHKSRPTFTFLSLVALAAASTYAALLLTSQMSDVSTEAIVYNPPKHVENTSTPQAQASTEIDTSAWKNYTDRTYFLSFKYPPTWQIETFPERAGYYIIVLKPTQSADHIRIYVSPNDYFALAGLPTKKATLAGAAAINVNDMLVGVKYAAQYYTFDMGTDTKLQPQFQKLLTTVAFSR